MNDPASPELSPADLRLESFNARALPRMFRTMLVVSVGLLAPAVWRYGWAGAIGFGAGAAVSCINFRALQRSVEALAERIVNRHSTEKGRRIVLRLHRKGVLSG